MTAGDMIAIAAVVIVLFFALRSIWKAKKKGSCVGCSGCGEGGCSGCGGGSCSCSTQENDKK